MAREVISHPDFAKTDTSSLLTLGGGGAQLQPDLVGKIDDQVATARPSTGYGMTETCGIITSIGADYFVDKPASCGPAMPVFETKVVDPETGEERPNGDPGELWVRGGHVIRGYINRPEPLLRQLWMAGCELATWHGKTKTAFCTSSTELKTWYYAAAKTFIAQKLRALFSIIRQ